MKKGRKGGREEREKGEEEGEGRVCVGGGGGGGGGGRGKRVCCTLNSFLSSSFSPLVSFLLFSLSLPLSPEHPHGTVTISSSHPTG